MFEMSYFEQYTEKDTKPTDPNMLKEPGAHDIGGMFGQNTTLGLGGVVIMIKQIQVLVKLQLELNINTLIRYVSNLSPKILFKLNSS